MSIYHEFQFRPSRLALICHGLVFLIVQIFLYQHLSPAFWAICCILFAITSLLFIYRQTQAIYLGHLDDEQWTLITQIKNKNHQQQVRISNMLNHGLYVVIYFDTQQNISPLVIWQDQLEPLKWKALKTQVQFKHFRLK